MGVRLTMEEQLQEDWLERRLREELSYIDDDGFTARVVQKLPAPSQRHSSRAAILVGAAIVAGILAYFATDGGRFLIVAAYRLAAMPLLFVSLVALCVAFVMTAVAASVAWSNLREQR